MERRERKDTPRTLIRGITNTKSTSKTAEAQPVVITKKPAKSFSNNLESIDEEMNQTPKTLVRSFLLNAPKERIISKNESQENQTQQFIERKKDVEDVVAEKEERKMDVEAIVEVQLDEETSGREPPMAQDERMELEERVEGGESINKERINNIDLKNVINQEKEEEEKAQEEEEEEFYQGAAEEEYREEEDEEKEKENEEQEKENNQNSNIDKEEPQTPLPSASKAKSIINNKSSTKRKREDIIGGASKRIRKNSNEDDDCKLPNSLTTKLFKSFSNRKISKEAMDFISQSSINFFKNVTNDLVAYANHAKRGTVNIDDAHCLLKRQRVVTDNRSLIDVARTHLPREYTDEIISLLHEKEIVNKDKIE